MTTTQGEEGTHMQPGPGKPARGEAVPSYRTRDPRGWMGDPKRGSALGRHTYGGSPDHAGRLVLRRVRLSGDYDVLGTYWGDGVPLYWLASYDGTIDRCFRAPTREDAVAHALALYPNAKVRR